MNTKPKFLYNKEGEIQEVHLSYKDYKELIEKIEDLEDIIAIMEAQKEGEEEGYLSEEEMLNKYKHIFNEINIPKKNKDVL